MPKYKRRYKKRRPARKRSVSRRKRRIAPLAFG